MTTYHDAVRAYYTYVHRAGYGRLDHYADAIIWRAADALGLDTDDPRRSVAPGVRAKMAHALAQAYRDEGCSSYDTRIDIVQKGGR